MYKEMGEDLMNDIVLKFITAFFVGAVWMVVLSFSIYRKSYYYKRARVEAGFKAEKPGLGSRLITLAILFVMIFLMMLFDLWLLSAEKHSFLFLFVLNLGLAALLSLFDALFIDYFLLLVWRPAILKLPEGQPTRDAMLRHIKLQLVKGWIFLVPIAVLGAAFSTWFGSMA